MIWSQKRKDEATVRDVIKYFDQVAKDRENFDRHYRGVDGYEFNCQPPSDFFSDELIEQGRKEIIKRKLEGLRSYVAKLEEHTIPKTKRQIKRWEQKLEDMFTDKCKELGYDVYLEYISVPDDTPENDTIREARKRGYIIQYKLIQ